MGLFITLEGVEGCGKSTQAALLARRLRREGFDCLLTQEPGATAIGRKIRRVILDPDHTGMCPETELGLYFSDRAQHLREVVWPALRGGRIVVCDRFTDSTLAYQGYGRGLPMSLIRSLDRIMTGGFRPDLTILLDLSTEEGLARAQHRNRTTKKLLKEGRFEREALAFHRRVSAGYRKMAAREPRRFLVVPAEGAKQELHENIWSRVGRATRLRSRKK